jgi:hypothetical protein
MYCTILNIKKSHGGTPLILFNILTLDIFSTFVTLTISIAVTCESGDSQTSEHIIIEKRCQEQKIENKLILLGMSMRHIPRQ